MMRRRNVPLDPVMTDRLRRYQEVRSLLKGRPMCREKGLVELGGGKFGKVFFLRDQPTVAVKEFRLVSAPREPPVNIRAVKPPNTVNAATHYAVARPYVELVMLILMSRWVLSGDFPHFPVLYSIATCGTKALAVTERAEGDLAHWLKTDPPVDAVISAVTQCLIALFAFYSMGFSHNDAHPGNFLYHAVPTDAAHGGYWHYKLRGKDVFVRNYGQLFVLWDPLATSHQKSGNSSNMGKLLQGVMQLYGYPRQLIKTLAGLHMPSQRPGSLMYPEVLRRWLEGMSKLENAGDAVLVDRKPDPSLIINKRPFRFGGVPDILNFKDVLDRFD